jgi:hypothetical protein
METPKIKKRGSRQEVFDGLAQFTSGNLSRDQLILNERTGKIITTKEKERGARLKEVMGSRKAETEELPPPKISNFENEELVEFRRTTSEISPEQKAPSKGRRTAAAPRKPKAAPKKKTVELVVPESEFDADQE